MQERNPVVFNFDFDYSYFSKKKMAEGKHKILRSYV